MLESAPWSVSVEYAHLVFWRKTSVFAYGIDRLAFFRARRQRLIRLFCERSCFPIFFSNGRYLTESEGIGSSQHMAQCMARHISIDGRSIESAIFSE